jgi:hypothetical protein
VKKDDVPQDQNKSLGGQRKAVYAIDEQGRYTVTQSTGWEAEEVVLDQAIEYFEQLAGEALERARRNQSAPLEFHMFKKRMDVMLLAQSTGFFKWRVRRHLKPAVFERLPEKILERYANALGLTIESLRQVPDDE